MRRLNMNVMRLTAGLAFVGAAQAQTPAPVAPTAPVGPQVGDVAPDFTLPASTKDGKLAAPIKLSNLKGQVVVLAFFPKARTGG